MACVIHTDLSEDKVLIKLQKDLTKKIELAKSKQYNTSPQTIHVYRVDEKAKNRPVFIPFNYGVNIKNATDIGLCVPLRKNLPKMTQDFSGNLREEQKICRDNALTMLKNHKSAMLSCYTGFGKTVTAINMASKIRLKTLITVPKTPLLGQWKSEITKFVPDATVDVLTPQAIKKKNILDIPDFCIINACNIHKMDKTFLASYGFVIVDEAHLQMTERLLYNLLHLTPRYLLGVTATPYKDGFDSIFKMFFGEEMVRYTLNREHIVYKIKTGFVPKQEKFNGYSSHKIDWNSILQEQSKDIDRNNLILKIVSNFKDRVFLILVKRIEQGQYLLDQLIQRGEKATSLLGKEQKFDMNARILIGTNSKIGTGFDHPKLNTLLVAADMVSYYIQFIGRVMRRKDVDPIIFDLVDSHPILKNHFNERKKVYSNHGGKIIDLVV